MRDSNNKLFAGVTMNVSQTLQQNFIAKVGLLMVLWVSTMFFPIPTPCQTMGTGSIQGTITDQSGAMLPNATVSAVDPDTGHTVTARTTGNGLYVLRALPPATYRVTVDAKGFETLTQENVAVTAFATLSLDIGLKVGHSSQTVTVSALPAQIDTANGTLETEIPHDVYDALPIAMNGGPKSALGFVNLAPGVSSGGNATFVLNGGAGEASAVYINGMPATNIQIGGDQRPVTNQTPLEAVQDFQVITSGIPAYYSGAGVINLVLKSGTDAFHGNIYENIRNTAFDAAGYFSAKTPVEHQNEYGVTLGGPILKQRLFFLFNYDGYRYIAGANPVFYTLPTEAERQGDFSALPVTIFDPSTTVCTGPTGIKCTRTAFPGNIIPAADISPISKFLESQLPPTINSNIVNNYLGAYANGNNHDMYLGKIDFNITKANTLSFVVQYGKLNDTGLPTVGGPMLPLPYANGRYSNSTSSLWQVKDTHVITTNLLNVFGFQYNTLTNPLVNPTTSGNWASKAGITGIPAGLASEDFPPIAFSGIDSPTNWATYNFVASQINATTATDFQDNLQWVHGRHDFTIGGELQYFAANVTTPSQLTIIDFSQATTAGFGATGVIGTNGAGYASYLLGDVNNAGLADTTVPQVQGRFRSYAAYVQDDWKAAHNLTLNLGIRYEIPVPFVEANNKVSFFNPTLPNPAIGGHVGALQFAGYGPDSCNCRTPVAVHFNTIEPRVGFAYTPQVGTVIRGSFSTIAFKSGSLGGTTPNLGQLGYAAQPSFPSPNAGITPAFNWNDGFPTYTHAPFFDPTLNTGFNRSTGPRGGGVSYPDPNNSGRPSYSDYWNITFQQQLTQSTAISISYAGSSSYRLPLNGGYGIYSNQLDPKYLALGGLLQVLENPTTLAEAQAIMPGIGLPYPNFDGTIGQMLRPFPQYAAINDNVADYGTGHYNSMQLLAQHVMSKGFFFNVNYTWSREIDDAGGEHARNNFAAPDRNAYNISMQRAVSTDPTQVFSGIVTWALPIGTGHALSFKSGTLNSLIGGWNLSAITQYQNGGFLGSIAALCNIPYAGSCYADYNPNFTGSVRINGAYGSGHANGGLKTNPVPYLNVNAFKEPAAFTYGTTPRDGAYGLKNIGGANESVAVDKTFSLWKHTTLKLRADAFNLFNRTVFGGLNTNISNAAFGEVSTQANQPRQLQFEAYLNF